MTNLTAQRSKPAASDSRTQQRRVVVGLDNAPESISALRFAATEAAYRGGDVLAVMVWHYPLTWGYPTIWPEAMDPGRYCRYDLRKAIDAVQAERAADGEPVVSITAEAVEGASADRLLAAADGAALLVLGARHHNRLLGSVSQSCVSRALCAVVIVPGPAGPDTSGGS